MGKGGDATTAPVKKEVLIDGVFYDVTNLKHPGGSVIDYYANQNVDATQPFYQFHIRSKSATKYLKSLPSRTADADVIKKANPLKGQEQLMKDFDEFTRQLEKEGYFKPSLPHVFYRTSEIIAIYGAGLYFLLHGQMILGILLMALGQGRCGWYMHEGGHYSLTGNVNIDVVLQMLFYGIGCGMSGSWWRIQHNKHHSTPQHLGYDVDLNTLPLVAFTDKVLKKVKGFQKFWIGSQSLLFPLIINLLVALGWQFYLHPRHILRRKLWIEAASCIARYVLWTVFITSKFGLWQSTLIYLAYDWVAANYIFLNFAVSHTHLDVIEKEDRSVDWVRYGAIYSMNVHPGPFKFINWWMGYLNFQIEHHLFPCMPQYRHPQISPRVKEFFEKHGLKYDQRSYFEALRVTFKNLHKVGIDAFYG